MLAHDISQKDRSGDVLINEEANFDSLLLSQNVLKGLLDNGFMKPSPIQLKAIPLGKCGFDLIVHSKSGTGKTLVFAVVALEMVDISRNELQVLIVAPTREIAVQIQSVIKLVGSEMKDLKVEVFIGGLPIQEDIKKAKSCQIAVGAPGRLQKLIEDGYLKLNTCRLFVLDEADKLLQSNMQSDINFMHAHLPKKRQTLALSATYEDKLEEFVQRYMQNPTFITPNTTNPMLLGLKHFVFEAKTNMNVVRQMEIKTEALTQILTEIYFKQCLVFFNYQVRVENLHKTLKAKGWETTYICGAMNQVDRLKAINDLKDFKCRILLSTDLTARGIDAANVDLVINYDIPQDASTYLHRMGRAGRYGSKGLCINIATFKEVAEIQKILGEIGGVGLTIQKLPPGKLPEDFWSELEQSFEVIKPIICESSEESTMNITKSVWEMKENNAEKENSKKKTKKQPKIDVAINDDSNSIEEMSVDSVAQSENSIDEESIFKSLANEENVDITELDAESILKNLGNIKDDTELEDENSKKRKRAETRNTKTNLLEKNINTLNLGKLLINNINQVPVESVSSIKALMDKSKAKFEKTDKSNEDILSDDLGELTIDKNTAKEIEHPTFNILQLAYDKAIERTQMDWFEFVKEPIIKDRYKYGQHLEDSDLEYWPTYNQLKSERNTNRNLNKNISKPQNVNILTNGVSESSEDEGVDDLPPHVLYVNPKNVNLYQENVNKVQKTGYLSRSSQLNAYNDESSSSQWCQTYQPMNVPAMPISRSQEYQSYFDYYGECLAQSVDTFSDVATFEVWYEDWKKNLQSTRDFVQRKIYMHEMNNHM